MKTLLRRSTPPFATYGITKDRGFTQKFCNVEVKEASTQLIEEAG